MTRIFYHFREGNKTLYRAHPPRPYAGRRLDQTDGRFGDFLYTRDFLIIFSPRSRLAYPL